LLQQRRLSAPSLQLSRLDTLKPIRKQSSSGDPRYQRLEPPYDHTRGTYWEGRQARPSQFCCTTMLSSRAANADHEPPPWQPL
jgi:hypothetical protein